MPTPITGAISFSQVRTELGLSGAISFSTTLVRQLSNQISGTATLGNTRAAKYLNSTVTNQNIFTNFFSSPNISTSYKVLIGTSGIIGGVGSTALLVGQFPSGSSVVINNTGIVRGFGGAAGTSTTGGAGGDAINANYPNQTIIINNLTGAFIQGGGGGGGKGGTGGGGVFTSTVAAGAGSVADNCQASCYYTNGGYCNGFQCYPVGEVEFICYDCYVQTQQNTNGGVGGNGGVGQGYNQTNTGGAAGAAGGTNAGAGGTGGSGASYGANGTTGATGANGNRTGGSAGSAGGSAGRYLVKGGSSVTLNNSGTIAGGLA